MFSSFANETIIDIKSNQLYLVNRSFSGIGAGAAEVAVSVLLGDSEYLTNARCKNSLHNKLSDIYKYDLIVSKTRCLNGYFSNRLSII